MQSDSGVTIRREQPKLTFTTEEAAAFSLQKLRELDEAGTVTSLYTGPVSLQASAPASDPGTLPVLDRAPNGMVLSLDSSEYSPSDSGSKEHAPAADKSDGHEIALGTNELVALSTGELSAIATQRHQAQPKERLDFADSVSNPAFQLLPQSMEIGAVEIEVEPDQETFVVAETAVAPQTPVPVPASVGEPAPLRRANTTMWALDAQEETKSTSWLPPRRPSVLPPPTPPPAQVRTANLAGPLRQKKVPTPPPPALEPEPAPRTSLEPPSAEAEPLEFEEPTAVATDFSQESTRVVAESSPASLAQPAEPAAAPDYEPRVESARRFDAELAALDAPVTEAAPEPVEEAAAAPLDYDDSPPTALYEPEPEPAPRPQFADVDPPTGLYVQPAPEPAPEPEPAPMPEPEPEPAPRPQFADVDPPTGLYVQPAPPSAPRPQFADVDPPTGLYMPSEHAPDAKPRVGALPSFVSDESVSDEYFPQPRVQDVPPRVMSYGASLEDFSASVGAQPSSRRYDSRQPSLPDYDEPPPSDLPPRSDLYAQGWGNDFQKPQLDSSYREFPRPARAKVEAPPPSSQQFPAFIDESELPQAKPGLPRSSAAPESSSFSDQKLPMLPTASELLARAGGPKRRPTPLPAFVAVQAPSFASEASAEAALEKAAIEPAKRPSKVLWLAYSLVLGGVAMVAVMHFTMSADPSTDSPAVESAPLVQQPAAATPAPLPPYPTPPQAEPPQPPSYEPQGVAPGYATSYPVYAEPASVAPSETQQVRDEEAKAEAAKPRTAAPRTAAPRRSTGSSSSSSSSSSNTSAARPSAPAPAPAPSPAPTPVDKPKKPSARDLLDDAL